MLLHTNNPVDYEVRIMSTFNPTLPIDFAYLMALMIEAKNKRICTPEMFANVLYVIANNRYCERYYAYAMTFYMDAKHQGMTTNRVDIDINLLTIAAYCGEHNERLVYEVLNDLSSRMPFPRIEMDYIDLQALPFGLVYFWLKRIIQDTVASLQGESGIKLYYLNPFNVELISKILEDVLGSRKENAIDYRIYYSDGGSMGRNPISIALYNDLKQNHQQSLVPSMFAQSDDPVKIDKPMPKTAAIEDVLPALSLFANTPPLPDGQAKIIKPTPVRARKGITFFRDEPFFGAEENKTPAAIPMY